MKVGTDLNRNWDSEWNAGDPSNNSCNEDYRGNAPMSAPEVMVSEIEILNDN